MTPQRKRRLLGTAAVAVVVITAVAVTLVIASDDTGRGTDQPAAAEISTATVTQRDLAEYLEITGTLDYEGTVTLTSRDNGVLMHLADEGTVLRRGEQIYLARYEPSDAETARILAGVASARDALSAAADKLSDAASGPNEADVAAARAAVAEAVEARDRLIEPPSPAEISSAEAAAAAASEALDALDNPTAGDLAAARAEIATAEVRLADLRAGPSAAEINAAQAAVQTAKQALADLRAGPSEAEIDTAEAARLAAWERLRDELQYSDNDVEIELARAELLTAEEALADLLAGPSDAEIDDAEARVLTAEETLAELRAGPTQAEIDDAEAQVLAARERLDLLENPTEVQYAQARADLDTAKEALAELRAGPTQAEIDTADASILTAERGLADLLAGVTGAELAALEASLASAEAELVSAQAEMAAHGETYRPLYVLYGNIPTYRNMEVGLEGPDIRQLQENLASLGFGDEALEVDGVFDEHTATAVRRWQQETGQHIDGVVSTADVLFVTGPSVIGSWEQGVETGQELEVGKTLASLTVVETPERDGMTTTQRVAANLPLSDRDLVSVGVEVNVELPDDTDLAGTVSAINPSPILDPETGENVVEVTILLSEPASPVWIGATVTVEITETLIANALVVPATALLALVEGGSAVEALDADGTTRLVGVETGLFVDGDVEVISAELEAGMRIVVPR
ncbi:peptidoglycan-binding protein [Candidatus Poriferisodalis sp.]|uniref:peptidoglycan-binding protein n=1 Tax=Candidatus Poriferisodalis sp. TaxID=3101277 RepID=UPI003B0179B2